MNKIQKAVMAIMICFVLNIGQSFAADITETYHGPNNTGAIEWNNVTNLDTTSEAQVKAIKGGLATKYEFFIDGTGDTVILKLQAGKTSGSLKDIDTDAMPDGVLFNGSSTNFTNVCLADRDFVDISFTSAGGGSQDVDIWLTPVGECN